MYETGNLTSPYYLATGNSFHELLLSKLIRTRSTQPIVPEQLLTEFGLIIPYLKSVTTLSISSRSTRRWQRNRTKKFQAKFLHL